MSIAAPFVKKRVSVLTADGRHLLGTLESCDQLTNIVLSSVQERLYSMDEAPTIHVTENAVMMIRGSEVVLIGAVDTIEEATCDVSLLRGVNIEPLRLVA